MSNPSLTTEKEKLEKKLAKERGLTKALEHVAELENSTKEQLEERLLDLSKTGQGLINTKNADATLKRLKDQVREQSALHNENIRRNKEHQRLVSIIISDKFGDELMDVKDKSEANDEDEGSED